MANAARADAASLAAGQEATLKLLAKAFEKIGISELDPLGEPFDPERHEAMMAQESATAEPEFGAEGGAAGLRAQRPAAAAGARHRGQGARA